MIRRTGVLVICIIFVGIISVSAQTLPKHTWELGTEISHIKYEEPGLMEEEGMMYGIVGSYTYHDKLMLKAEGKVSWGWVDYTGSTWAGTPLTVNDIPDFMLELRGLGGYDFSIFTASIITPYIGLGYRYLNDDSSGAGGYERESNYFYSPIGIEIVTELDNGWSIGAILEYDLFWWGKQITHLSDVSFLYPDIENDQNSGYGYRVSLKIQKKGKKVDFLVEPFFRYWDIDKSEGCFIFDPTVGYIWVTEPANNSTEYGIKLAVRF